MNKQQNIRIIHINDFVRADVDGHFDLKRSQELLKELAGFTRENPTQHILLDGREATSDLTTVDIFNLVSSLFEAGVGVRNKLALLNRPKDDFDRAAFLELCARNRGFNISAFRDFEAALAWLNE